jgi:hypothetical protein
MSTMKLDKTSEVWQRAFPRCVIIDPDGWDRNNFRYSFYEEKISLEEYNNRLLKSTIEILPAEKRKHLIQDEDFKNKLVELGFKDLGSGWFENEDNYIRIRIWKEYSVDFWLWKNRPMEREARSGFVDTIYSWIGFYYRKWKQWSRAFWVICSRYFEWSSIGSGNLGSID